MRNYTTEDIERYLEGGFSKEEIETFNQVVDENPEFKQEVELQRNLVNRVGVLAFAMAVQTAHTRNLGTATGSNGPSQSPTTTNGSSLVSKLGGWSGLKILGGVIIAISSVVGVLYLTDNKDKSENSEAIINKETQDLLITDTILVDKNEPIKEWVDLPQAVQFNQHKITADRPSVIKDKRSGAVIKIPAKSLINRRTGEVVTGEVDVKYREFRDIADIALSGIPMNYKGDQFLTAGMFEVRAYQGDDTLDVRNGKEVEIDFNMTRNVPGIGFYSLNDETQLWEKLSDITTGDSIVKPMVDTIKTGESYALKENSLPEVINGKRRLRKEFKKYNKLVNGGAVDLTEGTHFIQLGGLNCSQCETMYEDVKNLNNGTKLSSPVNYLIAYGEENELSRFWNRTNERMGQAIVIQDYSYFFDRREK